MPAYPSGQGGGGLSSSQVSALISAARVMSAGPWKFVNFAQNQTAVVLPLGATGQVDSKFRAPWAGSLRELTIDAESMSAISGTLTAEVYKNGVATGFSCQVATAATGARVTASAGSFTFADGDLLDVRLTSSATMNANGNVDGNCFIGVSKT